MTKVAELRDTGNRILSVYLYWYEGTGSRRLQILPGATAKAMWSKLPVEQQVSVTFGMMLPPKQSPADIQRLAQQYRDCLQKDFEETGGYTACEGQPQDAVIVIEYE